MKSVHKEVDEKFVRTFRVGYPMEDKAMEYVFEESPGKGTQNEKDTCVD